MKFTSDELERVRAIFREVVETDNFEPIMKITKDDCRIVHQFLSLPVWRSSEARELQGEIGFRKGPWIDKCMERASHAQGGETLTFTLSPIAGSAVIEALENILALQPKGICADTSQETSE